MKNKFSFLATCGLLLALVSCEKDEVQISATPSAAPALTASTTDAGTLVSADATKPALIYTWTPVTFTLSDGSKPIMPVTYTLEFAKQGTNFATIGTLPAGTNNSRDTVKVADLNTALVQAGLTPTVAGQVDVRLRASYSGNQPAMYSGVSQLKATPYSRDLFIFGSSIGSLSGTSPYLREQAGKPAQYEGYVWMPNATNTFRLSNTTTSAGTLFGAGAGGNTSIAQGSATEFTLAGPKMYRIHINLTNNSVNPEVTDWGIVGAATLNDGAGWNKSIPLDYDTKDKVLKKTLRLPGVSAGNLEFKFRANDAWDINLGDSKTKPGTMLEYGGDNLKTAGDATYEVTLNLNDPEKFTYTLTKK